jgi:hypothetical protein
LNISHEVNEIYRLIPVAAAMRLRPNIIPANTTFCLIREICDDQHSSTSSVDETSADLSAIAMLNNKLEVAAGNVAKKMRNTAGLRISANNSSSTPIDEGKKDAHSQDPGIVYTAIESEKLNEKGKTRNKRFKKQQNPEPIELVKWVACDGPCKEWFETVKDYGAEEIFFCNNCLKLQYNKRKR